MIIKRFLLFLLLSSVTGSVTFFYGQPQIIQLPSETEAEWQLPTISAAINYRNLFSDLRKWQLWGSEKEQKVDAKKNSKEQKKQKKDDSLDKKLAAQFVGVIKKGTEYYILLIDDDNKAKPYYAQSQLPNGALLVNIQKDAIVIQKEGEEAETIHLYY